MDGFVNTETDFRLQSLNGRCVYSDGSVMLLQAQETLFCDLSA